MRLRGSVSRALTVDTSENMMQNLVVSAVRLEFPCQIPLAIILVPYSLRIHASSSPKFETEDGEQPVPN